MNNKSDRSAYIKEVMWLVLGEALVSLITVLAFLIIQLIFPDKSIFDYTVVTGAILGCAVVIVNFFILTLAVNRAINDFMRDRGNKALTDEEAEAFANEHRSRVQLAVTRSYIIRTVVMIATLVVAFILEWFSPIATVVPLLMYKPIIYITQMIKAKKGVSGS